MAIPPFVQQILGTFVRAGIVWLAGYLAAGGVVITDDQITSAVTYIVPVLITLAWSLWAKHKGRRKLMMATSQAGTTEARIEELVADPQVPTPSVLTPKNIVPS